MFCLIEILNGEKVLSKCIAHSSIINLPIYKKKGDTIPKQFYMTRYLATKLKYIPAY